MLVLFSCYSEASFTHSRPHQSLCFAVVLYFSKGSDGHLGISPVTPQPFSPFLAQQQWVNYLQVFFTLPSLNFLSLLFSLYLSPQDSVASSLPWCFLSVLTWLFLPEGIPGTTLIFLLQINSLLSPISSSSS